MRFSKTEVFRKIKFSDSSAIFFFKKCNSFRATLSTFPAIFVWKCFCQKMYTRFSEN